MNPRSLTGRLLLAAGIWTLLALTIAGIVLSALFRDTVENSFDERLVQSMDALIGASTVSADGDIILSRTLADQRFDEPYSGLYWQISGSGMASLRSRSLWDQELTFDSDMTLENPRFRGGNGPDNQVLRILERDIVLPGSEQVYHYMVAGNLGSVEGQVDDFETTLFWALGAIGVGLLSALLLQVTFGLSPLARIRRGLTMVREGHRRRLDSDVPPEVKPLVEEVNAVLDHNDQLIERARTHVGNLAHALKTPLTVLSNASQNNDASSELIAEQVEAMRQHVNHHLVRARAIGRGRTAGIRTDVKSLVDDMAKAIGRIYAEKNIRIETNVGEGIQFRGEREDLNEVLGNLMDNAAKWCRSLVRVRGSLATPTKGVEQLILEISDDGPGVPPKERARLFKRGTRLDQNTPGTGLGLAIVRDIVEICGGQVQLRQAEEGGLKVIVTLPAHRQVSD